MNPNNKQPDLVREDIVLPIESAMTHTDPHSGRGGRYIRDPKTGIRKRVQYTQRCTDCKPSKKE